MSRQISDLCPTLQTIATLFLAECNADSLFKKNNAEVFLTCSYRSNEEQDQEYAKGRTKAGIPCLCGGKKNDIGECKDHPLGLTVTNARAGESPHNIVKDGKPYSKAFDFAIRLPDKLDWNKTSPLWRRAVAIGRGLGLDSGERWGDSPHFQLYAWKD